MKSPLPTLLASLLYNIVSGQPKVEIIINKQVQQIQRVYSVKSTDEIEINISLDSSFKQPKFIESIKAKTCRMVQDQQQEQRAKDKLEIFIENALGVFSQKRNIEYAPVNNIGSEYNRKILFKPNEITSCTNRFFWILLSTNPTYKNRLATIRNFKEKYQFMLIQ